MTAAEFIKKWSRYQGKETSAYQGHFDDLCRLLGHGAYPRLEPRDTDCAAKLKKRTLTNLYNERPAWLDLAHKKLDATTATAIGFPTDLTDEQILERLLALNLERAAGEVQAAKVKKPKAQRAKSADEIL